MATFDLAPADWLATGDWGRASVELCKTVRGGERKR
jgi:hypothetical protein